MEKSSLLGRDEKWKSKHSISVKMIELNPQLLLIDFTDDSNDQILLAFLGLLWKFHKIEIARVFLFIYNMKNEDVVSLSRLQPLQLNLEKADMFSKLDTTKEKEDCTLSTIEMRLMPKEGDNTP